MTGQNIHCFIYTVGNTANLPNTVDDWLFTNVASANAINANITMNLTSLLNEKSTNFMLTAGGGVLSTQIAPMWYIYYGPFLGIQAANNISQIKDITQAATTKFPKTP